MRFSLPSFACLTDGGRRRRTLLELSTALLDACVCTGVRCWGWLVSAIKWTNEGYKTIRFGFLFGVLCWLLFLFGSLRFHFFLFSSSSFFCAKVFYYYMYFLFLVDLWVGHFICTYSWAAKREREEDMQSACVLAGVSFLGQRSGMGSVRIYAQSLGVSICLLGVFAYTANVRPLVPLYVRLSDYPVPPVGTSFRMSCLCNRPH